MTALLVVPRRTSYTPARAWVGYPDLFSPRNIDVDISVVFTWDLEKAEKLRAAWQDHGCRVRIGGPALKDPGLTFTPGQYVKEGFVFTSRGCPRQCPWCYVPEREGTIRELPVTPGNVIQDNNVLACSRPHQAKVIEMLKTQRRIDFKGGLDARLLTNWFVDQVRGLRIHELWLAADHRDNQRATIHAIGKLQRAGFTRHKIRCYVMCGFNETMDEAEERIREIYRAGAYPYAQVWDGLEDLGKEWHRWARTWQRPALMRAEMIFERDGVYLGKKEKARVAAGL